MTKSTSVLRNPYTPGAGHQPPYLAGRMEEMNTFLELLEQDTILKNLVLTGLRGVGKTVLLDTLKPLAVRESWIWVGTDMSEQSSLTDERMATRLITDLATWTSAVVVSRTESTPVLARMERRVDVPLDFKYLMAVYADAPGLPSDKLKTVFEFVWRVAGASQRRGVIFAYDEAQTMSDGEAADQFPLSMLLDVFQSIQKKGIRFMLVLTGLPTLFPKLVAARTYAERMFRVVTLDHLDEPETKEAILKPIEHTPSARPFTDEAIGEIYALSGGYPYFIQFVCRELYDIVLRSVAAKTVPPFRNSFETITQKLDRDFFDGRWAKTTDRQRDLMTVIASIDACEAEFTIQQIEEASRKKLVKGFSASHVSQMLQALGEAGLVYKNRRGKYSFAVPMLHQFIRRQAD